MMQATTDFLNREGMNYSVQAMLAPHPVHRDQNVEGQYHLVRSTDNVVISPKTVSKKYVATCPIDMIAPIAPLIAEGWVTPERGFMLSGGSHEMLVFKIDGGKLDNSGKVDGEDWDHFFQLHNFQGSGSFFGSLFARRQICSNGAVRIVSKGNGFRLRHMGALQAKYEDAMRTWEDIQVEIRKLSKRMTVWNGQTLTYSEAVALFHMIYDVEDPNDIATRTENELNFAISEFSNPGRGTYGKTVADVYNAITATNTHYAPKSSRETETKRMSSLFNPNGSRNLLEGRAIEVLSSL